MGMEPETDIWGWNLKQKEASPVHALYSLLRV